MRAIVAELTVVGVLAAGCGGSTSPEQPAPYEGSDAAMPPQQMEVIQDGHETAINFWQRELGSLSVGLAIVSGTERYTCEDESSVTGPDDFSFYCPAESTAVITAEGIGGEDATDLFSRYVVSHEVAHGVQGAAGAQFTELDPDQIVAIEQGASCLAGYELSDSLSGESIDQMSEIIRTGTSNYGDYYGQEVDITPQSMADALLVGTRADDSQECSDTYQ